MNVGFYGLGIMGSRMAQHILSTDAQLTVFNRTISKAEPLKEQGALVANSPKDLAASSDILFTMLSTPDAVRDAALGGEGFLSWMKDGTLWIDCSTVNPSFSREMQKEAEHYGIRFMDAPVAGSTAPAEAGELLFLVGGKNADIEEAQPFFEAMGKKTIHAGNVGQGASLKMVFNLLLGEAMATFSEGMNLGQSLGLSKDMLMEALIGAPVVAPFITGKKEKIEENEYKPEFPLKWMHKDLHLATKSGYESGATLPTGNVIKELYALAQREGLSNQDFSAIYSIITDEKK
ncbi:NAD(P)-dependent oxidoreductase [Fodinibius sp. SL11]|uniref:NAD(P)-dependent oxidoreductase n=1 Tax=Fodinibius sp. SL11 TaxID=3425690 RepID=UPI003F880444